MPSSSCGAGAGEGRSIQKKTLAYCPSIAAWWHPTKSGGSQPGDFTCGSHQRVWLQCSGCPACGVVHEWSPKCYTLTSRRANRVCPSCASMVMSLCICNSVAANDRLVAEWHEDNPFPATVALGSSKFCKWRCSAAGCGHVWEARPFTRKVGCGCPQCARKGRKGTVQK
jgi:hypothetical protein